MHVRSGRVLPAALLGLALVATGCTRPSGNEINVSDEGMKDGVASARYLTSVALDRVELGKSLNPDRTIADPSTSFGSHDTVYVSIRVSGSANSGLVRALWTDQRGQTIQDDTRIVSPSHTDIVALQASPTQGWAGGRYQVDVYLDNRLADTESFTVKGNDTGNPSTH